MLAPTSVVRAEEPDRPAGQKIYETKCVVCHGPRGEGTAKHTRRLEGDRSVAQLATLIAETMPEDDPGTLSAAQAAAVAGYIHDAFYSRIARERNRPARVEMSRLTARQYRMALADVIGNTGQQLEWPAERGLRAEFFGGRRIRGKDAVTHRIDSQVDFDFGVEAPVPEITEPHEFSIRWKGSLLAPESGEYEFVIRTGHAARLRLNDPEPPLIDAWVKSGDTTEYRGTAYLVGGRIYPLQFEFSKGKQGVDDSDKEKEKPPSAPSFVSLLWKRPTGALEAIPSRSLVPVSSEPSYVCRTVFPPDDRSYGWERGAAVSKAWDQATTEAAIEAAGWIATRIDGLAGTKDDAPDRLAKLREWCLDFASRVFRRPLTAEESQTLLARAFDAAPNPEFAVRRAVVLVLKSPSFLYRDTGLHSGQSAVAARLAMGLWNSVPDRALREAAAAGQLATDEQSAAQARRMLGDPRAQHKLREFLLTWLKADLPADLTKDELVYPGFDEAVASDLRTSLEVFLDDVLTSDDADFRRLLRDDGVFVNARLAKYYGVETAAGAGFVKVSLDPARRAGALTHPYLMARFARHKESSPIHRGVFLARGVLGQSLRPPPEAVAPLPVDLHPSLTTRERVSLQTQEASCMTCHGLINPLGFTLEHFDGVGRYRESERDKPIDATGTYRTRTGQTVTVNGARELGEFLATSSEAHTAFVEQLFHHLAQQPVRAYGPETLAELCGAFESSNFNIRDLAVDIMVKTARAEGGSASGTPGAVGAAATAP